ncbi:MAG: hypothetical protein HFJ47_00170 [Clostridia bacterium]|nr:hypothetical protein [Clostridia bacterium]
MGSTFSSANAFGSLPFEITLNESGINIRIENIVINNETNPVIVPLTVDYDYKVILMKLGDSI